ncbi:MAG: hypothetical protein AB1540_14980 [Bdellovibrionota bacterium]
MTAITSAVLLSGCGSEEENPNPNGTPGAPGAPGYQSVPMQNYYDHTTGQYRYGCPPGGTPNGDGATCTVPNGAYTPPTGYGQSCAGGQMATTGACIYAGMAQHTQPGYAGQCIYYTNLVGFGTQWNLVGGWACYYTVGAPTYNVPRGCFLAASWYGWVYRCQ